MDARQSYALANPLTRADGNPATMRPLTRDKRHATGLLIRTILAVDR